MRNFGIMVIDFSKYNLDKAKELARKFGAAAVTEMAFNIQQLDLVDRGNLLNSVKYGVRTKAGEVDRVQFSYEWYGRFHETGANNIFGNGKELAAKKWRSEAIESTIGSLNDDFAEFYAELILDEIQIDTTKMEM